jgi:hypothetical protein
MDNLDQIGSTVIESRAAYFGEDLNRGIVEQLAAQVRAADADAGGYAVVRVDRGRSSSEMARHLLDRGGRAGKHILVLRSSHSTDSDISWVEILHCGGPLT